MIITRTPLRISLVGGGTDMPAFYKRSPGAVVSFAIDKYIYVGVNHKFDGRLRVSYSKTENVGHPMDLKHDIIRNALLEFGVQSGEIVTIADIPGEGTGLGSSSALAVGLSKALYKHTKGTANQHPNVYAERGYLVERELCLHPVGKQDHYASSYGGMNYLQFNSDDSVTVEPIGMDEHVRTELQNRMVLLWTGRTRGANDILKVQERALQGEYWTVAEEMRNLAARLKDELRGGDFSNIGYYLQENWKLKQRLAHGITAPWIDELYEKAIFAGAHGGKICGAGGGGFFLFFGEFGLAHRLETELELKHVPFQIDMQGCQVVYG